MAGEKNMDKKAVGCRIKAAREAAGMTQEQLTGLVGLSPAHISVIERGVKSPNLDTFVHLANALGCSADALLADVLDCPVKSDADKISRSFAQLPRQKQLRILKILDLLMEE